MPALYDNVTPLSTFKDVPPLIYAYSFEALNFRSCMLHYATNCLLRDVRTQLAWKHNLPLLDIEVQRVVYDVDRILNNPKLNFAEILLYLQQQYRVWEPHPDTIGTICLKRVFESAFPGYDLLTVDTTHFDQLTAVLEVDHFKHQIGMVCGSQEEAFDKILQTLMARPLDCAAGCWSLDGLYHVGGNLLQAFVTWAGDLFQSDMLSAYACHRLGLPPPPDTFSAFTSASLNSIQPKGDLYDTTSVYGYGQ